MEAEFNSDYSPDIPNLFKVHSKSLKCDFDVCIYTNKGEIIGGYCCRPQIVGYYTIFELNNKIFIDTYDKKIELLVQKDGMIDRQVNVFKYQTTVNNRNLIGKKTIEIDEISFGDQTEFDIKKVSHILINIIKKIE